MSKRMARPDWLEAGIYTIPEAAELVGAPQPAVRVWVEGHTGKQEPIIDNQLPRVGGKSAVSFANLMELRFIARFVEAGVGLREIRKILQEAKQTLNHPHPFATKTVFKTDGKKVVADIARRNGLNLIYDLRSRNYEMPSVVMKSLKENVLFDPEGDAIACNGVGQRIERSALNQSGQQKLANGENAWVLSFRHAAHDGGRAHPAGRRLQRDRRSGLWPRVRCDRRHADHWSIRHRQRLLLLPHRLRDRCRLQFRDRHVWQLRRHLGWPERRRHHHRQRERVLYLLRGGRQHGECDPRSADAWFPGYRPSHRVERRRRQRHRAGARRGVAGHRRVAQHALRPGRQPRPHLDLQRRKPRLPPRPSA